LDYPKTVKNATMPKPRSAAHFAPSDYVSRLLLCSQVSNLTFAKVLLYTIFIVQKIWYNGHF